MKWLLALLLIAAVAAAALYVPRKTAARLTARGLRATWDWVESLGQEHREAPRKKMRKAQAAPPPQHKPGREGIVAQPPKERIAPEDRAALDDLVSGAKR